MFSKKQRKKAEKILDSYRKKKIRITTAESCTGGLIAALLTEIPGSSDVFERGFVTYSNASKSQLLGVPPALIKKHGAVSLQVAEAMAAGALEHSDADLALSVTGIAGPGGGSKAKPVGTVYIAAASRLYKDVLVDHCHFKGKRTDVRESSVEYVLALLKQLQAFF